MRIRYLFVCVFLPAFFSTPALADKQSYCEVFGQDFANGKTSDVDQWESNFRNAFGDCMAQYAADGKVAAPAKKVAQRTSEKVVVVPARDISRKKRVPILAAGTSAWINYCAEKYASFDAVTGTYKSKTGQRKPCLVPAG